MGLILPTASAWRLAIASLTGDLFPPVGRVVHLLQTPVGAVGKLQEAFQRHGLGVFAISYDRSEILRKFARDKKISFRLLSDPDSRIIRAFNKLDTSVLPDNPAYGVP